MVDRKVTSTPRAKKIIELAIHVSTSKNYCPLIGSEYYIRGINKRKFKQEFGRMLIDSLLFCKKYSPSRLEPK